jgi:hypothetical protein
VIRVERDRGINDVHPLDLHNILPELVDSVGISCLGRESAGG